LVIALSLAAHMTLAANADGEEPAAGRQPPPRVFVHIDSPKPVELQREDPTTEEAFVAVCTSPCDTLLPVDVSYRIAAGLQGIEGFPSEDVRRSGDFHLSADSLRQTIGVSPRSQRGFVGGIVLSVLGLVAFGVGEYWLLADFVNVQYYSGDPNWTGAVATTAGGAAVLTGGLFLVVFNARTRVSLSKATSNDPTPWPFEPLARGKESSRENRATPQTPTLPLLRLAF
jgi:hypothetical protein